MAEEKVKPLTRDDVIRLIEDIAPKEKHELVLNRECVLRLIEENGGPENELDLSEMKFERGIDLHDIDIKRIILTKARLVEVHLEGANLREAHLEGANLRYAHFEEANLREAHLGGANLQDAHLDKADLAGAQLGETDLSRASLVQAHLEEANLILACLEGAHLMNANLEEADLQGAHLEGADCLNVNFEGADLRGAHLESAILGSANLKEAELGHVHLEGAVLWDAELEGADLVGVELSRDIKMEGADWGDYILFRESCGEYYAVIPTYRGLKAWYTEHGVYDVAGEFFYREMEAKRKLQSWKKDFKSKLWSWVMRILCGYGEKPERVVISASVVIFGLAAAYYFWGSFSSSSFWDTLYYSAASFTALGYGQWAPQPIGWAKGIGAAEAIIGVFMIALFLVTFTRKMIR